MYIYQILHLVEKEIWIFEVMWAGRFTYCREHENLVQKLKCKSINDICNIGRVLKTSKNLFYFQGDLGPPGFPGPTGPTGDGIQGEKVSIIISNMFVTLTIYSYVNPNPDVKTFWSICSGSWGSKRTTRSQRTSRWRSTWTQGWFKCSHYVSMKDMQLPIKQSTTNVRHKLLFPTGRPRFTRRTRSSRRSRCWWGRSKG